MPDMQVAATAYITRGKQGPTHIEGRKLTDKQQAEQSLAAARLGYAPADKLRSMSQRVTNAPDILKRANVNDATTDAKLLGAMRVRSALSCWMAQSPNPQATSPHLTGSHSTSRRSQAAQAPLVAWTTTLGTSRFIRGLPRLAHMTRSINITSMRLTTESTSNLEESSSQTMNKYSPPTIFTFWQTVASCCSSTVLNMNPGATARSNMCLIRYSPVYANSTRAAACQRSSAITPYYMRKSCSTARWDTMNRPAANGMAPHLTFHASGCGDAAECSGCPSHGVEDPRSTNKQSTLSTWGLRDARRPPSASRPNTTRCSTRPGRGRMRAPTVCTGFHVRERPLHTPRMAVHA